MRTLAELEISAVSLDGLIDDDRRRLVENVASVADNGMEAAFDELSRRHPGFLFEPAHDGFVLFVAGRPPEGVHAPVRSAPTATSRDAVREGGAGHLRADGGHLEQALYGASMGAWTALSDSAKVAKTVGEVANSG